MSSPPEGVLQMDWSCISPCVKRLLVASFLSFSVLSLSHFSWAGEPCRPPPASAERCGPAGPGARASPAPDMGRCAEPAPPPPPSSPPRGAHRGRLGTCRAQGPDWFSASPRPHAPVAQSPLPPPLPSGKVSVAASRPVA